MDFWKVRTPRIPVYGLIRQNSESKHGNSAGNSLFPFAIRGDCLTEGWRMFTIEERWLYGFRFFIGL